MRVDDPELVAKFAALEAAGYRYEHQEDARIAWLELQIARFDRELDGVNSQLKRLCDVLEAHMLGLTGGLS